jgi:quinol monooxygenase YgiN
MHILRVEHEVPDYDAWKLAFDSDPVGREQGGVRSYRVLRASDDPDHVLIDLEFDDASAAEAFHARLRELWGRVDVMRNPTARVAEVVEDGRP